MFVVAFYEIDMEYGGPEDGGWHFTCGELVRTFARCATEEEAFAKCRRANDLLRLVQRGKRSVSSMLYSGGRYAASVYQFEAPQRFPASRPHYS